jgi:hypothetical protein
MNELQRVTGNEAAVSTLIGQAPSRFAIGGRIRAGIKVLTAAATRETAAQAIYDAGIEAGKSFDDIAAEITNAAPGLRHPLVPKNVPYFSVRRGDFALPEIADQILSKFGEDRGDGVKRLYRFPVVFPADRWEAILPHALMCYGANKLKYWSEYSADGRERHCLTFAPVPVDTSGKRAIRIFGGRKHVRRAANDGRCAPEACPEYQARQCNLTGRFVFLIPGIPSINPFELSTNSFYSMNAARQTLETVGFLRGGRIGGFLDGRTSFWLTKREHEVAMIGDDGEPRRVAQWLIELDAPIDLTRLLVPDGDETRLDQGGHAAALLAGRAAGSDERASDDADGAAIAPLAGRADGQERDERSPTLELPAEPPAAAVTTASTSAATDALAQVFERLDALQIPRDKFVPYAKRKYGAGWNRNPNGIRRVLAALDALSANPTELLAALEADVAILG